MRYVPAGKHPDPPGADPFDVGIDTGTPVDDADYQVPFRFTGKIHKLTMRLGPEQLTPAERGMIYGMYRDRQ